MGQSSIIYVWFVTLGDGERSSLQSPSASCASSVLVSREDRPPCPGSSLLLLGSLHSCFFSSHSVPCHLCVTQPCVVLGPGGAVGNARGICCGAGAVPAAREGWAGTGCAALAVLCAALCWQSSRLSGVVAFPCAGPGDSGGLEVSPAQPLAGWLRAPCPPSLLPSYLFIQMRECDEVQKSKLAPERP